MIDLPQRRRSPTRDDFAAAVTVAFEELWGLYQAEGVGIAAPDWAGDSDAYSVSLPIDIARQGGDAHGVANIVKHAIEMDKTSIGRIARIERDRYWIVYFEAK